MHFCLHELYIYNEINNFQEDFLYPIIPNKLYPLIPIPSFRGSFLKLILFLGVLDLQEKKMKILQFLYTHTQFPLLLISYVRIAYLW